ncbi:MAG: hypothetical protein C0408_10770, partial [Odoribacter sp.]|nr:hypothetical protein [Odoribacter sp.]
MIGKMLFLKRAIIFIFGFLLICFLFSCSPSGRISILSHARYPDLKKVPVEGKQGSEVYQSINKKKQSAADSERIYCKKSVSDTLSCLKKTSSDLRNVEKKIVFAATKKSAQIIHKQISGNIIPAFTASSGTAHKKAISDIKPDDGF